MAIKFTQVVDFANQRLTAVGSPSTGTDAVNKTYVDAVAQGLRWKASVRAASTGNLTLATPGTTIDGVTMVSGDRFLAKDQSAGAENGIYVFNGAASAATRAPDADTDATLTPGTVTSVEEGTVNADLSFLLVTDAPIVVDTTALTFSLMTGGSGTSYVAGDGLTLTGSTFAVGAGTGISVASDAVAVDTAVVARIFSANVGDGSSTSITVNHNLGRRDVSVEVYTNADPWDTVYCGVQRPDTNNVVLVFGTAPASTAYRVVVHG